MDIIIHDISLHGNNISFSTISGNHERTNINQRPPRSTHCISSAASDVYKRQTYSSYFEGECQKNSAYSKTVQKIKIDRKLDDCQQEQ